MEKQKKGLFGIFKKAAVSPSSPPESVSSPDLSLAPTTFSSSGPRSPLAVDGLTDRTAPQGFGLVGTKALCPRQETECKGQSCDDEGESNDDETSGDSSIWRSAPLVQRRFSQSNASDGRQRRIAAEYRAKMDLAFDDLIRNRRLAHTVQDVASH